MLLPRLPCVLSIAGSDSGGGAGIQADLKTFCARRVYGATVVTALTAQNTAGVQAVHTPPVSFLVQQLDSTLGDFSFAAAKTGMLPTADIVRAVASAIAALPVTPPLVVDPVLVSTSGHGLTTDADSVTRSLKEHLFPLAAVLTPNLPEASALLGWDVCDLDGMRRACVELHMMGPAAVLLKGGHLLSPTGNRSPDAATDLFYDGERFEALTAPWVETRNTHGTGCTLASAIAAELAKGETPIAAVRIAKKYVHAAIAGAASMATMGLATDGSGPLHHMDDVALSVRR
jgi:hydroxymethylpyrimidine kinase/phosphomethylpyrimidine kinase